MDKGRNTFRAIKPRHYNHWGNRAYQMSFFGQISSPVKLSSTYLIPIMGSPLSRVFFISIFMFNYSVNLAQVGVLVKTVLRLILK